EVCGGGKVTYGFSDHGSYSTSAGVIVFDSDDAGTANYQGNIQGNEVTAALTSFGIVKYRHM
ncbi:MAG TPA: hypothetical protein VM100_05885, partial [Longimicrobiales bacterium]|nr:hypothetical protein [Longimicrobiales bacterium]